MEEKHKELCLQVLDFCEQQKDAVYFLEDPLTALANDAQRSEYLSIINEPIDFRVIRNTLTTNKFTSISAFRRKMETCFENSQKYCKGRYKPVYDAACRMMKKFNDKVNKTVDAHFSGVSSSSSKSLKMKLVIPNSGEKKAKSKGKKSSSGNTTNNSNTTSRSSISSNNNNNSRDVRTKARGGSKQNQQKQAQTLVEQLKPIGMKILKSLLSMKSAKLFEFPVDFQVFRDYPRRIPFPMDFTTIQKKLDQGEYAHPEQFARDVRRVFANCLRYVAHDSQTRNSTKQCLFKFEQEWDTSYPTGRRQLPEIKECLEAYNKLLQVKSVAGPINGIPTYAASTFLHPVQSYFEDNQYPPGYTKAVSQPIVIGEVISKLVEVQYGNVSEFKADMKRVFSNYRKYVTSLHGSNVESYPADVITLWKDAEALDRKFDMTMDECKRVSISKDTSSKASSSSQQSIKKNRKLSEEYSQIMQRTKEHKIKAPNGMEILSASPFLKAVDPTHFPDYYNIIAQPIDLKLIERSFVGDKYNDPMVLVADMRLLRDNCHQYNQGVVNTDVRVMADTTVDYFLALLKQAIKEISKQKSKFNPLIIPKNSPLEAFLKEPDPPAILDFIAKEPIEAEKKRKAEEEALAAKQAEKDRDKERRLKLKIIEEDSRKKSEEETEEAQRQSYFNNFSEAGFDMSCLQNDGRQSSKSSKTKGSSINLTLSLGSMPIIRAEKLEWEQKCEKVYKNICRHEYVDPNRKTAVTNFFVPVLEAYPSLREEYLRVVEKPMDLSTLKTQMDSGGVLDSQDFLEKLCLVFENSYKFNEPQATTQVARHMVDACQHLLNLSRWIALENLHLEDDSHHDNPDSLGPLRYSERDRCRQQRQKILEEQFIHNSAKVEEILRKLESGKRKEWMVYSVAVDTKLVPNYYMFVRKPMDLPKIKAAIANKTYKNFWEPIEDLRLMFRNARVFNEAHMNSDPTSKKIYENAIIFEERLEHIVWKDYTINLCDHLHKWSRTNEANKQILAMKQQRAREDAEEKKRIYEEEKKTLMKTDKKFAFDQDREAKRRVSLMQQGMLDDHSSDSDSVGDYDEKDDDDEDDDLEGIGMDITSPSGTEEVLTSSGRKKKRPGKKERRRRRRKKEREAAEQQARSLGLELPQGVRERKEEYEPEQMMHYEEDEDLDDDMYVLWGNTPIDEHVDENGAVIGNYEGVDEDNMEYEYNYSNETQLKQDASAEDGDEGEVYMVGSGVTEAEEEGEDDVVSVPVIRTKIVLSHDSKDTRDASESSIVDSNRTPIKFSFGASTMANSNGSNSNGRYKRIIGEIMDVDTDTEDNGSALPQEVVVLPPVSTVTATVTTTTADDKSTPKIVKDKRKTKSKKKTKADTSDQMDIEDTSASASDKLVLPPPVSTDQQLQLSVVDPACMSRHFSLKSPPTSSMSSTWMHIGHLLQIMLPAPDAITPETLEITPDVGFASASIDAWPVEVSNPSLGTCSFGTEFTSQSKLHIGDWNLDIGLEELNDSSSYMTTATNTTTTTTTTTMDVQMHAACQGLPVSLGQLYSGDTPCGANDVTLICTRSGFGDANMCMGLRTGATTALALWPGRQACGFEEMVYSRGMIISKFASHVSFQGEDSATVQVETSRARGRSRSRSGSIGTGSGLHDYMLVNIFSAGTQLPRLLNASKDTAE